jgi:hypothetical protein
VDLEDALVPIFQGFRAKATGKFVMAGDVRSDTHLYTRYRAARVLRSLTTWLRKKGVSGPKPLHTLRKEFGSRICDQFGIYAASRALRHADIAITSQHYVDKNRRTTLGLGHLLPVVGSASPLQGDSSLPPRFEKLLRATVLASLHPRASLPRPGSQTPALPRASWSCYEGIPHG